MQILHKQLLVLLCAATLGGGAYLHAQNDYPAPAKTPEEAATMFYQLLKVGEGGRVSYAPSSQGEVPFSFQRNGAYMGALSRAQMQGMSPRPLYGYPQTLFAQLAQEASEPQLDAQVTGTSVGQTMVRVSPSSGGREVVVVPEDGGYRVDVKATYGRWNDLSGIALDKQWYEQTGIASADLKKDTTFIDNSLRSQCQTQLKQQMLGVLQYAQDYDEHLPPARRWIDVLQPYIKSEQIFICPSLQNKGYGYAYNQNLSQFPQSKINEVALTVNIYETSNPNRNVFAPFTGRAYRHQDGINLAFADGHIKWFRQDANLSALTIKP